jgi:phosphoglycolate phosphatase
MIKKPKGDHAAGVTGPRMTQPWALVICDLDGTLFDSTPSVVAAVASTLDQMGVAVPTHVDLSFCVGPPLHESLTVLLGGEERLDEAIATYRSHYRGDAWKLTLPMSGAKQAVAAWSAENIKLAVCTYKPTSVAVEVLQQARLAPYFSLVVGVELQSDDRRPKADLLEETIRQAGCSKDGTLYVGDHELDAVAAATTGVSFARAGALGLPWKALAAKVMRGRGVES